VERQRQITEWMQGMKDEPLAHFIGLEEEGR
jgi:hypothetical protein